MAPGEEPPLAAHLVSPRRGYVHHGIYVGSGRVIHYAGLAGNLRRGPVEEISLRRFAHGRCVGVRTDAAAQFDRDAIIRRARSRLGENRYRILSNNCEHFCEWCVHGVGRSRQIEYLLAYPSALMRRAGNFAAAFIREIARRGVAIDLTKLGAVRLRAPIGE